MLDQPFDPNQTLKQRYRPIKLLGQGSFGKTYLAVDEYKPEKSLCVIQQFYPISNNQDQIHKASQRFELEAIRLEQLGKLFGPNIPKLSYFYIGFKKKIISI
ncbi:hypothetical protein ACL6C3_24405 [Capilliphycus salinus ALCB114379]|uniref:hypothetical protein n=1 Tax=Capilliphycus salinus TaxID=2768948 RepID=UPI0039A65F54